MPDTPSKSALTLVQADVEEAMRPFFPPTDRGFTVPKPFDEAAAITSGRFSAVVWEYYGAHQAEFQGVLPTGLPVVVRGATIVDHETEVFHRYVDWTDVMGQLGLTATMRPVVDELPARGG
jgi:hypothetical protein